MVKSRCVVTEDLVQELQETVDKQELVLVLLEVGQAAVAVTGRSGHQLLDVLAALADGEQRRLEFLGDVGHLDHVAAEQRESWAPVRRPVQPQQLRQVQRGAGAPRKQSTSALQDRDKGPKNSQYEIGAYFLSLNARKM